MIGSSSILLVETRFGTALVGCDLTLQIPRSSSVNVHREVSHSVVAALQLGLVVGIVLSLPTLDAFCN